MKSSINPGPQRPLQPRPFNVLHGRHLTAYTYDKLPAAEQQSLPNEGHIVAALEWAEPE
jgi:hypothetical protein